ncbi:MAG: NAD-dependent epimerase/dehydratase family protein [Bacillota bacterium]
MKILITGANSFIGKNLKTELINRKFTDILEINDCENTELLKKFIDQSDFIFHLLTLYRSDNEYDFQHINVDITKIIVDLIGSNHKSLLLLSSTQSGNNSMYGQSKLQAEEIVKSWRDITGNSAFIFNLANEFGKWCPPNLNSVVATFCSKIANSLDIKINNFAAPLKLMYIDDIIHCFISVFDKVGIQLYQEISPVYEITVGELAEIIQSFEQMRKESIIPNMENGMIKKLYSTYLSYLPSNLLSTPLNSHYDIRGSFTEMFHFGGMGQISINISKSGITKGNHWHHTKNEKFVVVSGSGIIRLRKVGESEISEYQVNGNKIEIIDIPPGYTHNITNTGDTDMITIMWANENFDPMKSDTYIEKV